MERDEIDVSVCAHASYRHYLKNSFDSIVRIRAREHQNAIFEEADVRVRLCVCPNRKYNIITRASCFYLFFRYI